MDVTRLNINFGGDPSPGFEGDEEEFRRLERLIGCGLPDAYVSLLTQADGGHPELGYFRSASGIEADVDAFYGIANPNAESVFQVYADWSPFLGKSALPFGQDGGGSQFYIATDLGDSIWMCSRTRNGSKIRLADSLQEFLLGLEANPDFI